MYFTLYNSKHIAGLVVEVFLDQNNYMLNKLSKKAGARVIVHDPENPPLADEDGLDLRPNTASSIAIQVVSVFCLHFVCSFVYNFV